MNTINIKKWYNKYFPEDELGKDINPTATFNDLDAYIEQPYNIIGVGDSIIRERVFSGLAKYLSVSYEVVYKNWLNLN